jgi:hypothetical protein
MHRRSALFKKVFIIISLLISPLLGPRTFLWITHKKNGSTSHCDRQLNGCLPKHGEARNNKFSVTHPITDHCEHCLTSAIAHRAHWLSHKASYIGIRHINDLCFILGHIWKSFIIIIISLLMSPLLGHKPSLWITHKKNGHNPPCGPSAAWWVLTTANAAGTHELTCLPKQGGARANKYLVSHPMTDQRCLTSTTKRTDRGAIELLY